MASVRTILPLPRGWQGLQQTHDPLGLSISLTQISELPSMSEVEPFCAQLPTVA